MAPSELKKLRNKQRKAQKKAEQTTNAASGGQAGQKQGQTGRKYQHHDAPDPEAPQLEELVPDKLAKVDEPLKQAIKFLTPLQTLGASRIETHLMAFEIYFRKGKLLLMLQSVKRARKLDSIHPKLYDCMARLHKALTEAAGTLNEAVNKVLATATAEIYQGKTPEQLNTQYLDGPCKTSLAKTLQGTRVLVQLDPSKKQYALDLITRMDFEDCNISNCSEVLQSMKNGDFGSCDPVIEDYLQKCQTKFPYARAFKFNEKETAPTQVVYDSSE